MRRTLALTALLVLPLSVLAACGGDDDDAGGSPADTTGASTDDTSDDGSDTSAPDATGGGTVTVVAANVQMAEDDYSAPAGEVTFIYENEDSVRHTLLIEGVDEGEFLLEVEDEGDTDEGTVELEAGDYELFCDVPGHASMRAGLTVE